MAALFILQNNHIDSLKVIDLTKTSKLKLRNEIEIICGGQSIEDKWLSGPGRGLGGLTFIDPEISDGPSAYSCSLAFYYQGLGIYFRNSFANYHILIHEDEIVQIDIHKPSDKIKPFTFSLYRILSKLGMNPLNASQYLMPKEILEEYPASCTIRLQDTYFYFTVSNVNILKFKNTLSRTKFAPFLEINIKEPQVIQAKNGIFDQTTKHQNHSI
jgi:hypothetical protein